MAPEVQPFEPINRNFDVFDGTHDSDELKSVKKYFFGLLKIIDDYL